MRLLQYLTERKYKIDKRDVDFLLSIIIDWFKEKLRLTRRLYWETAVENPEWFKIIVKKMKRNNL